jgi:hypothetical protein
VKTDLYTRLSNELMTKHQGESPIVDFWGTNRLSADQSQRRAIPNTSATAIVNDVSRMIALSGVSTNIGGILLSGSLGVGSTLSSMALFNEQDTFFALGQQMLQLHALVVSHPDEDHYQGFILLTPQKTGWKTDPYARAGLAVSRTIIDSTPPLPDPGPDVNLKPWIARIVSKFGAAKTSAEQLSENWDIEDEQRFDVLVKKEALDEITSSEWEELELLSEKRDRTVARVSDAALAEEKELNRALSEFEALLEKHAPPLRKNTTAVRGFNAVMPQPTG